MKKIIGMGNALVDILSKIESDNALDNLSLAKGSMQLIDGKVLSSLKEQVTDYHLATGGSASNTISGLAKLGVPTGFIGKIGEDNIGDFFREDASRQGVQAYLLTSKTNNSGCCFAFISPDGERTMATHLGAACELDINDLHFSMFENCSILHIEGYLIYNRSIVEKAILMAKEAGLKISIDLASFNVVDENLEFLRKLITEYVDIVFANEEEAKSFTGKEAQEALLHISDLCEIAVVKIGKDGSYIKSREEGSQVYVPATEAKAIDTTGAGDLYASGFLYGLTSGFSLEDCGRIGSIVAGNVVEVIGAKMEEARWNAIKYEINKIK
jgi:sugar/nucleoside kinase (ribokinase family)